VGGVGWYRKHFTLQCGECKAEVVRLRFDGVYMNSDTYLNGHHLGNHPYGYTTFEYTLPSAFLNAGGNVLAVRVNNYGKNSRWYSGSGIFRHVWLSVTPALHVPLWGITVTTPSVELPSNAHQEVAVTAPSAIVTVEFSLANDKTPVPAGTAVVVEISGPTGVVLANEYVKVDGTYTAVTKSVNATLQAVQLWSPDHPALYRATAMLVHPHPEGEFRVDDTKVESTFGVRTIQFDAQGGFRLNGKETKLYGGCLHHANGPLGSKAISRAEERRVQLMKANGYNAIRTSHNPVSPAFLDAADREGVLVMDEAFDCWSDGKNPDDYHVFFDDWWQRDIASMVLRDRNHPSVVLWSIGNEIPMRATAAGYNLSHVLADYVRSLDPSGRAVTSAYPFVSDAADKFFAPLDVAGYNYSPNRYMSDHKRSPTRVIVGTESFPKDSFQMWDLIWKHSHVIGDFIWTALDYTGESDIGFESQSGDVDQCAQEPFPWHISFCGDIDNAGHQKPQAYYRKVLWGVSTIELAVHDPNGVPSKESVGGWGWTEERQSWNWPGWEGKNLTVNVYAKGGPKHSPESACTAVSLTTNDGTTKMPVSYSSQFTSTFHITYKPGTITATCHDNDGKALGAVSYSTADAPVQVALKVDRSEILHSRDDLAFVTVEIHDVHGTLVPDAAMRVSFKLAAGSAGEIVAVGNGNPQDLDSFEADSRMSWRGKALVILRPSGTMPGTITLHASAPGLPQATVAVKTVLT